MENPHSADAIIAGVVEDLGLDDNSPATLRALRRDLEEREIESLPERVAALTHESKVKVNTLVTQLEDEEYEAVASRIPVERRVEIEMLADPESFGLAANHGEKGPAADQVAPTEESQDEYDETDVGEDQ